ncbi:MAG TPA: glutamine--fructose-6-phosphate transaminase (isomerizing) [Thermomicrobiales bacterium]|nr:glutamine--fructose-6-phosphate transaminase (isomerizing) [Thermomicrobiales bacterium]
MCGIFGYVGAEADTGEMVLSALRRLEYRGYDSWGVGVGCDGAIAIEKQVGKIGTAVVDLPAAEIGFGHTRWATHGGVTQANAHPMSDATGRLAVIHNGIIENHRQLRERLITRGYRFQSETDTEVVVHLVADRLEGGRSAGDVLCAVSDVFKELRGLNAIILLDQETRTLTAVKNVSPLVIGRGSTGLYVASDTLALAGHAGEVMYLDDLEVAQLGPDGVRVVSTTTGERVAERWVPIPVDLGAADLGGYDHFLQKEIFEQPNVIERIAREQIDGVRELAAMIRESYGTFLVGCGTASYAALTGNYLFSRIARRHVNFVVGSEFAYQEHFLTDRSLVVAHSQSGETVDVIEPVLAAKARGAKIAALVNVKGSTLDRIADFSLHLNAGPEQAVLSTKAYSAKIATLLLTAHILNGSEHVGRDLLWRAVDGVRQTLTPTFVDRVREVAACINDQTSMFVVGRGLSYPTALEAALKIKEVSYIHAEGFAGGELKHGVIALIEQGTPCIVYSPLDETRDDIISGAMEMKARGGYIIGISPEAEDVFDIHLPIADAGDASPLVMAPPAQMLGYQLAVLRGLDPDKPRNLAKSVTVK